jgi:ferredoxin
MIKLRINKQEIKVAKGSTILSAARELGIFIPTMCFYEGYEHFTSCMVCVVEDLVSGKLLPSCSAQVEEGMIIETENDRVRHARRTALELLLSEHVGDCEGMCRQVCPAHMNIPLMLRHMEAGRNREALKTIKEHIALPAVLGRICPAPCEKACRRGQVDHPLAIRLIHRLAAEQDLSSKSPYIPSKKPVTGKKVAVVGAGPAGLAAAYYLLQEGHSCTIFDEHPQPGGTLRYEVPVEILPRIILDSEIKIIRKLGADFQMNIKLGRDISMDALKEEFHAIILAIGKPPSEEWNCPEVFVCGGAKRPVRMAVKSMADGRSTALLVSRFLHNHEAAALHPPFYSRLGKLKEGEVEEYFKVMDIVKNTLFLKVIHRNFTLKDDSSAEDIVLEAGRCLHCECLKSDSCKLRQYAEEYQVTPQRFNSRERKRVEKMFYHPHVIHEPGKCIKCGLCVRITREHGEYPGLTFIGRGFDVRIGIPVNGRSDRAFEKVAALCVKACPTGALSSRGDGIRGREVER